MVSKTATRTEDPEVKDMYKYFFKVILEYVMANLITNSNITLHFIFASLKISFSVRMYQVVK